MKTPAWFDKDPKTPWTRVMGNVMLLVALALTLAGVWRWVSRSQAHAQTRRVVETSKQPADAASDDPPQPKRIELAEQLVQHRNIMSPPPPSGFTGQLTGVIGDQAVFNGQQMAGVGESVMGAKVTSLGPDWVEIEFKGNTRKLWLFGAPPHAMPGHQHSERTRHD